MHFNWQDRSNLHFSNDAYVITVPADLDSFGQSLTVLEKPLQEQILALLKSQPAMSDYAAVNTVYALDGKNTKRLLFIGQGKKELSLDQWRSLAAEAARAAQKAQASSLAFWLPNENNKMDDALIEVLVEGLLLGTYSFDEYKTDKQTAAPLTDCCFLGSKEPRNFKESIERGEELASAIHLVRDLINHPASAMMPKDLAAVAQTIATESGLAYSVLNRSQIKDQKMNAFAAVAQGSAAEPQLIVLEYIGNPGSSDKLALVGKGITFDSGGISLKPASGMEEMKDDMGGAATVLGTMQALGRLKPKTNVIAVLPCTENMPSGTAYRPGDIITAMNGKTIEVISTDAEGRLILADALTYAKKLGATRIVDLATLTGACVVALGSVATGVFTNQNEWCRAVLKAAKQSGEKMWQLPLYEEYEEQIKSSVADMKNTGGREAGAITAALFLKKFVEETPWVHLDIAGTVTTKKSSGYYTKGATGVAVRTLVTLAQGLAHEDC